MRQKENKTVSGLSFHSASPKGHPSRLPARLPCSNQSFKGQAAVELLSYSAFFLLAFLGIMVVFFQMQSQELTRAEHAYAQEVAWGFSDQIRTAFVAGPGFAQTVSLPPNILGKPYAITVSRKISTGSLTTPPERETGFVYVDWQGPSGPAVFSAPTATTSYDVQTSSCISNPSLEFIVISSSCGQIRMENRNGTILIK